jgi:hypothetical protein
LAFAITPANAGLTAYWPFDVDYEEQIGTVSSNSREDWAGVPTIGPVGKFGNALQSGSAGNGNTTVGVSSFDIVPSVISHTAGTMEAWINPTGTGETFQFLLGSAFGDAANGLWTTGIHLYLLGNDIQAFLESDDEVRDWPEPVGGNATLSVGQWNHVALTWDAAEVNLFANGNRVWNEVRDTTNWRDGDDHFFIAGSNPGGGRGFHGGIDDAAIWDEVRYSGSTYNVPTAPAPEPVSLVLLAAGGTLLRLRRRS